MNEKRPSRVKCNVGKAHIGLCTSARYWGEFVEGFVCHGGTHESTLTVNRWPLKLVEMRLGVVVAIRLEYESGERVLRCIE
jgi:hypothetical protein